MFNFTRSIQELINACENTVIGKFTYIPNKLSNCTSYDCDKFMVRKSPYNTSMFNIAWLKSVNQDNFRSDLSKVITRFAPHPFALWLGPNSLPRVSEEQLGEMGFVKEANELGMSLNLSNYIDDVHTVNTEDIFEVKDKTGMEHFIHVLEAYDPFVREYYLKVIDELGDGSHPFRFFWLSVYGKAACITSLFFNSDHCGIFDVLTNEDHRKKGFAYRLMKYVLSYAKKQGSSYMCLTASSPQAVNLYRKMGFNNFGDYECYEFKAHNHTQLN